MTGPEHFKEAERLARLASNYEGLPNNSHIQAGQIAQVHATLALAAATADLFALSGHEGRASAEAWKGAVGPADQPSAPRAGEKE